MTQHILIIDGTLSQLDQGFETHCGKLYKLLTENERADERVYYDPGVQGEGLYKWMHVAAGTGLRKSICQLYLDLANHYTDGDQILFFGYSRGAYAVRLLAGMIDQIGLLRREYAWRHLAERAIGMFEGQTNNRRRREFRERFCHKTTQIDFLGVWDTVSAIGIQWPILHHFAPFQAKFHDHAVPSNVKMAFHALSRDETRRAYRPELWKSAAPGTEMKQMLFAGDHAVVGCHILRNQEVRKIGNFSFHWMMGQAEKAGLILPQGWQDEFPTDPHAPDDDHIRWYERLWFKEPRKFSPREYFDTHPSVIARHQGQKTASNADAQ